MPVCAFHSGRHTDAQDLRFNGSGVVLARPDHYFVPYLMSTANLLNTLIHAGCRGNPDLIDLTILISTVDALPDIQTVRDGFAHGRLFRSKGLTPQVVLFALQNAYPEKILDTIHDLDYCMQVAVMVTVTAHDSYAVWNAGKPRKFYQISCALMSAQIQKTQSVVMHKVQDDHPA
jgi:hypothetical protein